LYFSTHALFAKIADSVLPIFASYWLHAAGFKSAEENSSSDAEATEQPDETERLQYHRPVAIASLFLITVIPLVLSAIQLLAWNGYTQKQKREKDVK
jgi:hypothetical protein